MGKGLAFGQKVGNPIDKTKIEKEFVLNNKETNFKFQQLLQEIPADDVLLAEKIISEARNTSSKIISDSIFITLTNHLSMALERIKKGIIISNPLTDLIKNFYPEEFILALQAQEIVKKERNILLPLDEIAFLTIHFVTAELDKNKSELNHILSLIQDLILQVKKTLAQEVDESSSSWQRFLTHLAFLSQRIIKNEERSEKEDILFDSVANTFSKAHKSIEFITEYLKQKYNYIISKNEQSYLMIHINRLQLEFGLAENYGGKN